MSCINISSSEALAGQLAEMSLTYWNERKSELAEMIAKTSYSKCMHKKYNNSNHDKRPFRRLFSRSSLSCDFFVSLVSVLKIMYSSSQPMLACDFSLALVQALVAAVRRSIGRLKTVNEVVKDHSTFT